MASLLCVMTSYFNTFIKLVTFQYVHYAIDEEDQREHMRNQHREALNTRTKNSAAMLVSDSKTLSTTTANLTPPQWIQCDM